MAEHNELTAAAAHVPGYVQDADPGAIGADKFWGDTTGSSEDNFIPKLRNTSDDGWGLPRLPFYSAPYSPTMCGNVDAATGMTAAEAGDGFTLIWHETVLDVVYLVAAMNDTWHYEVLSACTPGTSGVS